MNQLTPNIMERTFKPGVTEVCAFRRHEDGTVAKIKRGIVLQNCGAFVRVFDPRPIEDGGDPRPDWSEFFPTALGGTVWLDIIGQRPYSSYVPPELRF